MWRCSKCGTEFEGNFCSECGEARIENDALQLTAEGIEPELSVAWSALKELLMPEEKVDQPSTPEEKVDQPSMPEEKMEQPSMSEEKIEQPSIRSGKMDQQEIPEKDYQQPIPEEKSGKKGCIIVIIVIIAIIALLVAAVSFALNLILNDARNNPEDREVEIAIYVEEDVYVEEEIEVTEWASPFNFDVWDSPEVYQIELNGIVLDVPVPPNVVVGEETRDCCAFFFDDTWEDWLEVEVILRNMKESDFGEYFADESAFNWDWHSYWAEILDKQEFEDENMGLMITHWGTDWGEGFTFTKISQYREAVLLTEIRAVTVEGREELFEVYGFMDSFGEIMESVLEDIIREETDITQEQVGFDSPEEAVIAFLEGVRDSDLDRMTAAVFDDSHDGVHALEVSFFYAFFLYFYLTEDFLSDDFQMEDFHENLQIDDLQFLTGTGPSEFQSLEILGFIPPETFTELYLSESNQTNLSNQAERLGADQLVSCVVLFELDGEKYMTFLDVADVDGRWRISQFNGNIGNLLFLAPMWQGIIPPEFMDEFIGEIDLEELMIPVN